jgi:hypothetical protein
MATMTERSQGADAAEEELLAGLIADRVERPPGLRLCLGAPMSTEHTCPGPRCEEQIPYELLACRRHWYQVPKPARNAVYGAWKNGAGAGTTAHTRAMEAAIKRMRAP